VASPFRLGLGISIALGTWIGLAILVGLAILIGLANFDWTGEVTG
jgi:hypothetical protein